MALYVASRRDSASGLILVTPYDSIADIGQSRYPIFPISLLIRDRFDSTSIAPLIHIPTLVLMAGDDEVIPQANTKELLRAFRNTPHLVIVP